MDTPPQPTPLSRPRIFGSFRFRLTIWFVLILALITGGFSLFIYFRQIQVLHSEAAARLAAHTTQLESFFRGENISGSEGFEEETELKPNPGNGPVLVESDRFALVTTGGGILQRSEHFSTSDIAAIIQSLTGNDHPGIPIVYELVDEEGHENGGGPRTYLFLDAPVEIGRDVHAVLILGSPVDPGSQLPRLALTLTLIFGLTLITAFGGGYWLADRAMGPVETITRTARSIGEHDLQTRLHLNRSDELGELAATFDRMLDRIQAAFERQRQFTTDASHELRTPLTIVELETSRALGKSRSPIEYENALQIIRTENEWMSRLVNELLTLARMDTGSRVSGGEAVDLADVALEVVERMTGMAEKHGVKLETGALAESPVEANRDTLVHLVTNLVENGIKYRGQTAPRVLVETGLETTGGRSLSWVRVEDNGIGISPEHLSHVFDRFYRVDAARGRQPDEPGAAASGSGLGLAIVRSIAEAFGGEAEIHSATGTGTVATVRLPGASLPPGSSKP